MLQSPESCFEENMRKPTSENGKAEGNKRAPRHGATRERAPCGFELNTWADKAKAG
jgi:hypothetical protein